MQRRSLLLPLAILVVLAPFAVMAGCSSSSNKGTNPMPTVESFSSGGVIPGASFVHTFNSAGDFGYRCTIHNGMSGTISVTAGGPDSMPVAIGDNFFNPNPASVKPGGYVRWINGGGVVHTVTRP